MDEFARGLAKGGSLMTQSAPFGGPRASRRFPPSLAVAKRAPISLTPKELAPPGSPKPLIVGPSPPVGHLLLGIVYLGPPQRADQDRPLRPQPPQETNGRNPEGPEPTPAKSRPERRNRPPPAVWPVLGPDSQPESRPKGSRPPPVLRLERSGPSHRPPANPEGRLIGVVDNPPEKTTRRRQDKMTPVSRTGRLPFPGPLSVRRMWTKPDQTKKQ